MTICYYCDTTVVYTVYVQEVKQVCLFPLFASSHNATTTDFTAPVTFRGACGGGASALCFGRQETSMFFLQLSLH